MKKPRRGFPPGAHFVSFNFANTLFRRFVQVASQKNGNQRTSRIAATCVARRREFTLEGGLMNYGAIIREQFHEVGYYTARILRGEKPADMPVQRPTKLGFVLNLKTALALGIDVPPTLLALADEVIE
jgi:ABC-type uncharacterized transport system substrate-binding protein